jgi:type IX secretion system PorP/SprF family membrane protein
MMRLGVISSILLLASLHSEAQDARFSQLYSNPLYMNPAFAGTSEATRFALNHRLQWPGLGQAWQTMAAGGESYLHSLNAGYGISFVRDVAGINRLSNTVTSLYYSQHLRTGLRTSMAFGMRLGIGQRSFNTDKLLFADQVIRESAVSLESENMAPVVTYGDVGVGMVFFHPNYWGGWSLEHVNQPSTSFYDKSETLDRRFSLHGGGNLPIGAFKHSPEGKSVRLAFQYTAQRQWDQLDVGGYYTVMGIHAGLWYRGIPVKRYAPGYANHESLVFLIAYESLKGFGFGYSYDHTLSRLAGFSNGAHEISLKAKFVNKAKRRKPKIIPCAKF